MLGCMFVCACIRVHMCVPVCAHTQAHTYSGEVQRSTERRNKAYHSQICGRDCRDAPFLLTTGSCVCPSSFLSPELRLLGQPSLGCLRALRVGHATVLLALVSPCQGQLQKSHMWCTIKLTLFSSIPSSL